MQYLRERIKHITEQMKIKKVDLAKALSKDKSLVSHHFSGKRKITSDDLEKYIEKIYSLKKDNEDLINQKSKEMLIGTYEWADVEYQKFTNFIPKSEIPTIKQATSVKESIKKANNNEVATNVDISNLKSFLLGTAVASAVGVGVNIFSNKMSKKVGKTKDKKL